MSDTLSYDSKALIGKVEERFDDLKRKNFEWGSFYNGWIEGRIAMLAELREKQEAPK
jgi:hypothetical protein